ncbi:MAG: response regulator [PVC group bacterium]|nr:response regulator [PVC group bacterium]
MDKKMHILIVDDEQIVRETIERVLRNEGFSVQVAECGNTAVELAKTVEVDVALLDIKMPGIDGIETLVRLKALKPKMSAIMMTGYELPERLEKAFAIGACACLHKPFDIQKLLDIVEGLKNKDEE